VVLLVSARSGEGLLSHEALLADGGMATRSSQFQLKTTTIDDTDLPATVFLLFFFFLIFFLFMQEIGHVQHSPNRYQRPRQGHRRLRPPPPPPGRRHDARRAQFSQIAEDTLDAIRRGYVNEPIPNENSFYRHSIAVDVNASRRNTILCPDDFIELRHWQSPHRPGNQYLSRPAKLAVLPLSTIQGARYLRDVMQNRRSNSLLGILNFASATKPGGGFINGAIAQEESIARSSSLYESLSSRTAKPFYELHKRDDGGGLYTHSMIYSPTVVLFRDDNGAWMRPLRVEVVTSPAVNAGLVRKRHGRHNSRQQRSDADGGRDGGAAALEGLIREVMTERMGRILALFELRGVRNLVLGSFGTGVFQNDVRMVAEIWRELLVGRQARFSTSFDRVLFAIPDGNTLDRFKDVLGPVSF
jgi:uncharacterized protein (TIGR02452 family)